MAEKKKNNKYVKIITRIIGVLSVIISIIFIGMMFYSNIIPNKFLYPAMIFILIFTLLCTILIFKNKAKIVLSVILLITSSLCLLGSNYFYQTIHFMDVINNQTEEADLYYVVVLKQSKYKNIDDIEHQEMGMMESQDDNFNKALERLHVSTKEKNYQDPLQLANDLLNQKIEVIFVKNIFKDLYDELIDELFSRFCLGK